MMLLLVFMMVPGVALAEEMNLAGMIPTYLLSGILAACAVLIGMLFRRYICPVLDSIGLKIDADTAVRAVEVLIGRGNGETKWKLALNRLQKRGWNVDTESVRSAVRAAWSMLDTEMILIGEKEVPGKENPENGIE